MPLGQIHHRCCAILATLLVVGFGGCIRPGPLEWIDEQADRVIEHRQILTLGPQPAAGVNVPLLPSGEPDAVGDQIYDIDPATNNPTAESLVIEQMDPSDPETTMADPAFDPAALEQAETVQMNLEQVLEYAIANAPEYRDRKEDLYLATLALIVERHLWGARFFNTLTTKVGGAPESGDHDQVYEILNEFVVTQRLPYGGSVAAGAMVNYVNYLQQSATSTASSSDSLGAELSASIDLPLLRGAGQAARGSLIQAERDLIYAVRDFERFRRTFFVDIANTYFGLIRRMAQIENRQLQVQNLERLADRFLALAEAGRVPFFEAEQSQSNVLLEGSDLIIEQDRSRLDLDAFKATLGMPTISNLELVPSEVIVPLLRLEPERAIDTAFRYRLDLQTSSDRIDDARREVKDAKNKLLPDLDLFGSISLPTDSDRDTVEDFDSGDGQYEAGMRLGSPLDREIEISDYRAAWIGLERARRSHNVFRDQVALEVRRSIREIRQARINLELNQRGVQVNERRERAVQLRERTLGPRDVIEAQEDLLDARNRRDQALAELRQSVLRHLLDTGQMRISSEGRWLSPGQLAQPAAKPMPAAMP